MKIILRADVENLGRLGDVVTVKAGYGRNYLLPQGLAMLVTPGNLKAFELERKKLQARMDALRAAADDIAGKLEGLVLPIVMRVGDNDKLYGSVTTASKWIVAASCSTIPSVPLAITPSACVCMPTSSLPSP